MKKMGKITIIFTIIFLLAVPAFSFELLETLKDGVEDFSEAMAKALPFNSTIGLNWSDAYIGKLIGVPPHFGVGLSAGFTTIPITALEGLKDLLQVDIPLDLIPIGFPLPAYTAEARLGGFFLPFDLGFKFGYIPQDLLTGMIGVGVKYQLIGADIRFVLLNPKVIPIKLSVGAGFNHLEGGITAPPLFSTMSFDFDVASVTKTLEIPSPDVGLIWETNVAEVKAQLSLPLLIITPYIGAGISYSWSKAGYHITSEIKVDGEAIEDLDPSITDAMKELGISGISNDGFGSIIEIEGWNMRVYGGISFNLAMIRIDLTAMYNFYDKSMGATFGLRFQL